MRYFMRFSKFGRVTTLAALTLVSSAAVWARPIITGPGTVAVGANVVFTISDDAPGDGFNPGLTGYVADFKFVFDTTFLQFVQADALIPDDPLHPAVVFNGALNASGEVLATLAWLPFTPLPTNATDLFTLTFTALASTGASSTMVNMSLPDGGAYGDGGSFDPTRGSAAITSAVPEPQSLALLAIGGVAMLGARRRRTHQQQHQQQHQQS